jgi:hypothetical protein
MSLERIQIVKNFTTQFVFLQALDGTPTTPYDKASAGIQAQMAAFQRVGRLRLILAASAAVTITDANGVAYTVTNAAAASTLIHDVPVINGHVNVKLSGSGTLPVVILAD